MQKIKDFFADKRKLDHRLRWAVRVFLVIGISYLMFFDSTKVITEHIEITTSDSTMIVYDRVVGEKEAEREKIKTEKNAAYHKIDSIPRHVDSIADHITRATRNARQ